MANFNSNLRETLIAISREMFPHKFIEKSVYARVVDSIGEDLEERQREQLEAGVKLLDEKHELPFVELTNTHKIDALKSIEHTAFFQDFHGSVLRSLYSDPEVWPHFGYEGPSSHLGGYIKRGFNDASWIPDDQ